MKFTASTDSPNVLIAEIAQVIKELYPLDLSDQTDEYHEHPKIKKISKAVGEHMNDYATYIEPWKSFLKNLPKGHKSKVYNSGNANEFAYSGRLTLERYEDDAMYRTKALIFNVSWLTNYFTVYGIDETAIKENEGTFPRAYPAINVVTVSPYREFEDSFNYMVRAINAHFPQHQFIPFNVGQLLIDSKGSENGMGFARTIYNSLFNNSLDLFDAKFLRGDKWYGAGESDITITLKPPPLSKGE